MYSAYHGYYDMGGGCDERTFSAFSQSYWERSLFQRCRTLFRFSGLPDAAPGQVQTDLDAFLYGLFRCGFLAMFETRDYGITFQPGTLAGIGLQYQPTGVNIASPYFNFMRPLKIGEECAVIKLTPDYMGIWDIISKYATELKLNDVAIRLSQINARFAYAIASGNQKDATSIKKLLEKLANGEPGVVYDVNLLKPIGNKDAPSVPWAQFDRDLKQNFILPELLAARRTTLLDFYREIGVRVNPDKKERMVNKEAQSYDAETFNRREVWNISLQESLRLANKLYGTNIAAEFIEPEEVTEDALSYPTTKPDQ